MFLILIQLVGNCVFPDNLVVIRTRRSLGEILLLDSTRWLNSNVLKCISHLTVWTGTFQTVSNVSTFAHWTLCWRTIPSVKRISSFHWALHNISTGAAVFPLTLIEAESRSSAVRRADRLAAGHSLSAGVSNAGHLVCSPPPRSCSSGEQSARRPFQPGTGFQSATWVWSKQHRPDACLFKVWNDPSRSAGLDWHCLLICGGLLRITRLLANSRLSAKHRRSTVRKTA